MLMSTDRGGLSLTSYAARAQSQAMLQEEADVDSSYRATYGTLRWTRPPSVEVSAPLVQRAEQLEAVLNAAAESDGLVRAKFGEWEEAIGVLDRGQVSPSARAFGS